MIQSLRRLLSGALNLLKGMAITSKNLFSHAVTLQYPDQKMAMTEQFRGLVDLYPEKCIACYQCVKICPTGCLSLTHRQLEQARKAPATFIFNAELCCYCGFCEQVCPTQALYMNKIYEMNTYDHSTSKTDLLDPQKYAQWISSVSK